MGGTQRIKRAIYDGLGNRQFRLGVYLDVAERMKERAAAEKVSLASLLESAIGHWVLRKCPNPARSIDEPEAFLTPKKKVVYVRRRLPSKPTYPVTIWLSRAYFTPMLTALKEYRSVYPDEMGWAVFPVPWLSRIVVAYLDDDWKGFTRAETERKRKHERETEDAGGVERGTEPGEQAVERGRDGVLPPPASGEGHEGSSGVRDSQPEDGEGRRPEDVREDGEQV